MAEKINELSNRQTLDDCLGANKNVNGIIDIIIRIGNSFFAMKKNLYKSF